MNYINLLLKLMYQYKDNDKMTVQLRHLLDRRINKMIKDGANRNVCK